MRGGNGGLRSGSWRCTSVVIDSAPSGALTGRGGIGRLALDFVESALYLLPTSSLYSGFSALGGVTGTRYVSVDDLSRS